MIKVRMGVASLHRATSRTAKEIPGLPLSKFGVGQMQFLEVTPYLGNAGNAGNAGPLPHYRPLKFIDLEFNFKVFAVILLHFNVNKINQGSYLIFFCKSPCSVVSQYAYFTSQTAMRYHLFQALNRKQEDILIFPIKRLQGKNEKSLRR
jgi:hypothetical protein